MFITFIQLHKRLKVQNTRYPRRNAACLKNCSATGPSNTLSQFKYNPLHVLSRDAMLDFLSKFKMMMQFFVAFNLQK